MRLSKQRKIFSNMVYMDKLCSYRSIPGSFDPVTVGHMDLMYELEDAFDIMLKTDDVIDLSSFEKGREILEKGYGISF